VTLTGAIYNLEGEIAEGYNGVLCYEVYDAEEKKQAQEFISTSMGNIAIKEDFNLRQYKLATAADTVVNGRFTATFTLPAQTLQSDNPGFISLYSYNNDMNIEAAGYSKNIVINGSAEAVADVTAPEFTNIWIGDEYFSEGGIVPPNALFHCDIIDSESGITSNELSIGKGMIMLLDGKIVCNDLAGYYTPACEYGKGSINYPFKNLTAGAHHATVKVFDNAGNAGEITIAFYVEDATGVPYELYIEEEPITTQATLSIVGAIEQDMSIQYIVADKATGNEVWRSETSATEVVWNLTGKSGNVVPGEYIGYALISAGDKKFVTKKKKLIILAQ
jgi:hypothetical protein